MNINQLKYFIAVAQYRNFTKAAKEFSITQTAITQQIQTLEDTINVKLIDRKKRPIGLTPAGDVFLIEAKAIVERTNNAISKTQEASSGFSGNLKIGFTKGYERSNLSNILKDFHDQYPNIFITCSRSDIDHLYTRMRNGDDDIVFTWGSTYLIEDKTVDYIQCEKVPFVVALYNSHPFSNRHSLRREDLKYENIMFLSSEKGQSLSEHYYMNLYKEAGFQPNIIFRSTDVESLLMMVAAQEGVCILPQYATSKIENADNITFIPLEGEKEFEDIICAWQKSNSNEALFKFVQFLKHGQKNKDISK